MDFRKIYQEGKKVSNKGIILRYLKLKETGNTGSGRIAVVAGKKLGNAVKRNRLKRLLREAYRINQPKISSGYSFMIIARPFLQKKSFGEVEEFLVDVFRRGGLLREKIENDNPQHD